MRRFDDHGQYNMLYFNYLTRFLPDTIYRDTALPNSATAFVRIALRNTTLRWMKTVNESSADILVCCSAGFPTCRGVGNSSGCLAIDALPTGKSAERQTRRKGLNIQYPTRNVQFPRGKRFAEQGVFPSSLDIPCWILDIFPFFQASVAQTFLSAVPQVFQPAGALVIPAVVWLSTPCRLESRRNGRQECLRYGQMNR